MALDATVGSPDANSYVTVNEADAYFEDRTFVSAWDAFTDKASALVTASQMLDWYVKYVGYKATSAQGMQWPRTEAYYTDGTEIADDVIPPEIKKAVYELTLSSLESDRTADDDMAGISYAKVGNLAVKATKGDYSSTAREAIPQKVWKILSELIISNSSVVRLIRA